MTHPISPLAPQTYADPPAVAGVRFATVAAGLRYSGRTDTVLMAFAPGTSVAGVFTRSLCPSAPVDWCRDKLGDGQARALVVNSGNANAFTGSEGVEAVALTASIAAQALACAPDAVFVASTGVIGEPLAAHKFDGVLQPLVSSLADQPWLAPAKAIMTTDTFPKLAGTRVSIEGAPVTISGIAKGSGMIAPDMATMLAFVFTDAPIAAPVLQTLLARHAHTTFNAITVDSDTSTSDTLMAFATGQAAMAPITDLADPRAAAFGAALHGVLFDLAMQVVRDGEGASKFVAIRVTGAQSEESAAAIARAVANSPLVKTAIAGEDANWGRIVMAVGKAGQPADRDRLTIRFGDLVLAREGRRAPDYDEDLASAYMKNAELEIGIDLGLGDGAYTAYTCDLTHGYIDINGSYRS